MLGGLVTPAWCASYLEPMNLTVDYRSYGRDLCVRRRAMYRRILDSKAVSLGKITDTSYFGWLHWNVCSEVWIAVVERCLSPPPCLGHRSTALVSHVKRRFPSSPR